MIRMYIGLHVNYLLFFPILMKFDFSLGRFFQEILKCQI